MLVDYSNPIFIGCSWSTEFQADIAKHRRTIPVPFAVQVLGTFSSLYAAQAEARPLIKRFLTNIVGYNKTDYGDLDNKRLIRTTPCWSKGMSLVSIPKYDSFRRVMGAKKSIAARRDNYASRLPYHAGDSHPNKREDNRNKIKKAAQGRRRYYREDGSWTWQYAPDHHLAHKNRDNGIPDLQINIE